MQERLQKIISASGLMSRRAAEECIKVGRVRVNGVAATPWYERGHGDGQYTGGRQTSAHRRGKAVHNAQ